MSSYSLLGILGGTFDPVHNGHISIAHFITETLQLERTELIPCHYPPHRHPPGASALHRLRMLTLAAAPYPKLVVNDIELQRQGPSYTIDTLIALHTQWPDKSLCLIIGVDAFIQFNQWHRWEGILQLAHLIVMNRPGYALSPAPWLDALIQTHQCHNVQTLAQQRSGLFMCCSIPPQTVSATDIRQRLQQHLSITADVPPDVANYIYEHHLYQ